MTAVRDSHRLTSLEATRARLEELRRRGEWPAVAAVSSNAARPGALFGAVTGSTLV